MNEELMSFALSLLEDTQFKMDEYQTPEMAFTAVTLDKIVELLECTDPIIDHCILTKPDGLILGEIHAYAESVNGDVLYLFYTDYNPLPEVKTKSNVECQPLINRPQGFYDQAIRYAQSDVDSSSAEYRALKHIYDNVQKFNSVNIVILSNYIINNLTVKRVRVSKPLILDTWDLKKLHAYCHSGSERVGIDLDFDNDYDNLRLPYWEVNTEGCEHACISTVFSATLLYKLFEKYDSGMFYGNLRNFLGIKGKGTNFGMLATLKEEKTNFLAYNNGITAVARSIETQQLDKNAILTNGKTEAESFFSVGLISRIIDFRVVDGMQTIATIYESKRRDREVNLEGAFVTVKIIVSSNNNSKIVRNIAISSNSQNKVRPLELLNASQFCIELESLSRSIMIPNDKHEPLYWFYERIRDEHKIEMRKCKTRMEREYFDSIYPSDKKFNIETLAKIWISWGQEPEKATKGSFTNCTYYLNQLEERHFFPDEEYYKKSIALIIIYKYMLSRPDTKKYGIRRSPVTIYAMAYLNFITNGYLDLNSIWKRQYLSDALQSFIDRLCDVINEKMCSDIKSMRISTWSYARKHETYDLFKSVDFGLDICSISGDLIIGTQWSEESRRGINIINI